MKQRPRCPRYAGKCRRAGAHVCSSCGERVCAQHRRGSVCSRCAVLPHGHPLRRSAALDIAA